MSHDSPRALWTLGLARIGACWLSGSDTTAQKVDPRHGPVAAPRIPPPERIGRPQKERFLNLSQLRASLARGCNQEQR